MKRLERDQDNNIKSFRRQVVIGNFLFNYFIDVNRYIGLWIGSQAYEFYDLNLFYVLTECVVSNLQIIFDLNKYISIGASMLCFQ